MRILLVAFGLIVATAAFNMAAAQTYPWCAQYGSGIFGGDGGRNCGFSTLQQCQATVSGIGGFCERNPWYTPASRSKRGRSRR
jgi:hypothetical protein